ncbi:MAG: DegT/DnrJ/EryC1/StrS family aminotransferase [Eubacteriales bacterium]|nr:DegT/DnrJ/EryC1/StrS family aminotransferase [Eubacteriales bacterium]
MSIFVTRSSMPDLEEFVEEIKPIWKSHYLTNMGPIYKKFQYQLKDYLSVPQLSLFANGHMALELAIQALNLSGEIITTPYTFASTTHAIVRNGITPVFCDIKPDDYTMDPEKIEELITDKTTAILPVHVYGNMCDVEAIDRIAKKYDLKVIYDAAHAFGVTYNGIGVGNFGDASMFSFHATKVFNTIEGGAVTFSDVSFRKRLHYLKNFGIVTEDEVEDVGANAKLDEFRAAMGICNLRHIKQEILKRKAVFEKYMEYFQGIDGLRTIHYRAGMVPNYSYFPLYIEPEVFGTERDTLCQKLNEYDIYARKYFYPATNEFEAYKGKLNHGNTPVSDKVSKNILTLPMFADLPMEAVDRICEIVISMSR